MATFGERLRFLREKKGLKQVELAKLLNLESSSTISQYETLNRIPDGHILQGLADIFNCSVDYLLARTDILKESASPNLDEELTHIIKDLGTDITLHFYDLKGMTDDEKEDLKIFLQVLKARRAQKEGK